MRLIKDTPMEVAWRTWRARPEAPTLTVVAKATFELAATGPCPFAAEQRLPSGEVFYEDDVEQSARHPDDLVPIKPRAECMVIGSVRPPSGQPATSLRVSFMVGPVGRQLRVHGDRHWTATGISPPLPFEEMPLRWERCFGGPGFEPNPLGRGIESVAVQGQSRILLPNIEDVSAPIGTRLDRPLPAGTGPIPLRWPVRMRYAGTYDARWQRERWPSYPEDLSWEIFNSAPLDLRVDGFFRGDERIQVYGCHPERPRIDCQLPGLLPRAFLRERGRPGMRDVGLRLDTVVLDLDTLEACCLWRGVVEVKSDALEEVDHLFVVHHPLSEPRSAPAFEVWFQSALKKEDEGERDDPEEPPEEFTGEATSVFASGVWEIETERRTRGWREALAAEAGERLTLPGEPQGPEEKREALAERWAHLSAAWQDSTTAAHTSPSHSGMHLLPEADRESLEASLLAAEEEREVAMQRREEVVAALTAAAGGPVSLAGRDLSGADLSGLSLEKVDLRGALLTGADLSRASLREVALDGAQLGECELSLARFYACGLTDADLSGSRMEETQLVECALLRADLSDCYLAGARLIQCTGAHLDLSDSVLIEAQVNDCALPEARMYQAVLDAARFLRSDLRELRMEGGASAVRAVFDGCELRGLRASEGADLSGASLRGARADEASFHEARMVKADLTGAQLARAELDDADLTQARLDGAILRGASLDRACLQGAMIRRADLFQARLEGADLRLADLRHSSLFQAELLHAQLQGAELEGADLSGTRLREGGR